MALPLLLPPSPPDSAASLPAKPAVFSQGALAALLRGVASPLRDGDEEKEEEEDTADNGQRRITMTVKSRTGPE